MRLVIKKLVMGPGQKILTWCRSIFCGLGRVGSGQVRVWVWKISPKNVNPLFTADQKKVQVGSGQGPSQKEMQYQIIFIDRTKYG